MFLMKNFCYQDGFVRMLCAIQLKYCSTYRITRDMERSCAHRKVKQICSIKSFADSAHQIRRRSGEF